MRQAGNDPVLEALDGLVEALRSNIEASNAAIERAKLIQRLRAEGLSYIDISDEVGRPVVVNAITDNLQRLRSHGAEFRREQAKALHAEGMTMDQIGALFGVTRQRVSAILKKGSS